MDKLGLNRSKTEGEATHYTFWHHKECAGLVLQSEVEWSLLPMPSACCWHWWLIIQIILIQHFGKWGGVRLACVYRKKKNSWLTKKKLSLHFYLLFFLLICFIFPSSKAKLCHGSIAQAEKNDMVCIGSAAGLYIIYHVSEKLENMSILMLCLMITKLQNHRKLDCDVLFDTHAGILIYVYILLC